MRRHVAVLMGGLSAEREVSLVSGEACARALEERGYAVTRGSTSAGVFTRRWPRPRPTRFQRAPTAASARTAGFRVCSTSWRALPHSGVLASAVAMDKPMAKRVFVRPACAAPRGLRRPWPAPGRTLRCRRRFVVKPAAEGSSVGVVIVLDQDSAPLQRPQQRRSRLPSPGRKLRARAGSYLRRPLRRAAGGDRDPPNEGFYDYRAKYIEGFASHLGQHRCRPTSTSMMERSPTAHRVLGCRGVSRGGFPPRPGSGRPRALSARDVTLARHDPLSLVPSRRPIEASPSPIWWIIWWSGRDATCEPPRRPVTPRPRGAARRDGLGRCACGGSPWLLPAWARWDSPPMRSGAPSGRPLGRDRAARA